MRFEATTLSGPIIAQSWKVPDWYFDFGNSIGCASDTLSGTSATCVGGCSGSTCPSGLGPLLSVGELYAHRWGTDEPILQQTTRWHVLSSAPVGQERIVLKARLASGDMNWTITGSPSNVGVPFGAGAVTPKSQTNPGTDLLIANMPVGATRGMIVHNVTRASDAVIASMSGSTATMEQPFASSVLSTPSWCFGDPPEDDTWQTGDTLQLQSLPTFNFEDASLIGGDSDVGFTGGIVWLQGLHIPDVGGASGISNVGISTIGTTVGLSLCVVDPYVEAHGMGVNFLGSDLNGGMAAMGATAQIFGGAVISPNSLVSISGVLNVGDDCIAPVVDVRAGQIYATGIHVATSIDDIEPGASMILAGGGVNLWGAGTLNVDPFAACILEGGGTWANAVKMNALRLSGSATGSKYSAGTWTDGISLTPASMDANGGRLQDPSTGARFVLH